MDYYDTHTATFLAALRLEDDQEIETEKTSLVTRFSHGDTKSSKAHQNMHRDIHGTAISVTVEQAALFMIPAEDGKHCGTLISFFQYDGTEVSQSIKNRLTSKVVVSLLRKSEDISFLLQAIVDNIVDQMVAPVNWYTQLITQLDQDVIDQPKMMYTRQLHLICSELALLRRTLMPVNALVHGMQNPNSERWISPLAVTYLADVLDHSQMIVEDIDTMSTIAKNNIDLIFNSIAYQTNESMKNLTTVSIIFLPITFLAGVYGTNFKVFPELDHPWGIGYFWAWCGVSIALVVLLINWNRLMSKVPGGERMRLNRKGRFD